MKNYKKMKKIEKFHLFKRLRNHDKSALFQFILIFEKCHFV